MRNIAYYIYMHCERWIRVPLWRNYKMIAKMESPQPWLSQSIVTKHWVKAHAGADFCRQKIHLKKRQ